MLTHICSVKYTLVYCRHCFMMDCRHLYIQDDMNDFNYIFYLKFCYLSKFVDDALVWLKVGRVSSPSSNTVTVRKILLTAFSSYGVLFTKKNLFYSFLIFILNEIMNGSTLDYHWKPESTRWHGTPQLWASIISHVRFESKAFSLACEHLISRLLSQHSTVLLS